MSHPSLPIRLEGMRFKGDRDYLHGTDILPVALRAVSEGRALSAIQDIDISFHAFARTALTLRSDVPVGKESRAQLRCIIDGLQYKLFLVEDGRSIAERSPYPEDQIVAATSINAESMTATSTDLLPFTNIERWIAMTKALHHEAFPDALGKWLFARAKLASYRDTQSEPIEHRITIKSHFGGKLTRAALSVGGNDLGEIYFALA